MEIPVPKIYYEWNFLLKALKTKLSDDEVMNAIQKGEFSWQGESAGRLARKIYGCIISRINEINEKFRKETEHFNEEGDIVNAILMVRKEFNFLLKLSEIESFPENRCNEIRKFIQDSADGMQQSLENSTKDDKIGKLHSIIKNNRINLLNEPKKAENSVVSN